MQILRLATIQLLAARKETIFLKIVFILLEHNLQKRVAIAFSIDVRHLNASLHSPFCLRLFKYHCVRVVAHKKVGGV
uniref:Uncharacterized protein n=1 Tax=Caenorhabditis japonica TaxID=281687 RepID=A0A8R1IA50_CAEJA